MLYSLLFKKPKQIEYRLLTITWMCHRVNLLIKSTKVINVFRILVSTAVWETKWKMESCCLDISTYNDQPFKMTKSTALLLSQ